MSYHTSKYKLVLLVFLVLSNFPHLRWRFSYLVLKPNLDFFFFSFAPHIQTIRKFCWLSFENLLLAILSTSHHVLFAASLTQTPITSLRWVLTVLYLPVYFQHNNQTEPLKKKIALLSYIKHHTVRPFKLNSVFSYIHKRCATVTTI